jgi:hypothetical protein
MSPLLKVGLMSWWQWHFCLVGHMTVGKKSRHQTVLFRNFNLLGFSIFSVFLNKNVFV